MLYRFLFILMGTYCGNNKPYIKDMKLTIVNETVLDVYVKLPRDTITCNNQHFILTDDDEIVMADDCVENELKKHKVDLEEVYFNNATNEVTIETNVGDMLLEPC